MTTNETPCDNQGTLDDDDYFDQQDLRVINIVAPGKAKELEDVPTVNQGTIKKYFQYLSLNLDEGLLLTGRESLGYFAWEEAFEWEGAKDHAYNQLRKKNGSYEDKYLLQSLHEIVDGTVIMASVLREVDKKAFNIPLEDLEVCSRDSVEYELLEDYSYWVVNFFDE